MAAAHLQHDEAEAQQGHGVEGEVDAVAGRQGRGPALRLLHRTEHGRHASSSARMEPSGPAPTPSTLAQPSRDQAFWLCDTTVEGWSVSRASFSWAFSCSLRLRMSSPRGSTSVGTVSYSFGKISFSSSSTWCWMPSFNSLTSDDTSVWFRRPLSI